MGLQSGTWDSVVLPTCATGNEAKGSVRKRPGSGQKLALCLAVWKGLLVVPKIGRIFVKRNGGGADNHCNFRYFLFPRAGLIPLLGGISVPIPQHSRIMVPWRD